MAGMRSLAQAPGWKRWLGRTEEKRPPNARKMTTLETVETRSSGAEKVIFLDSTPFSSSSNGAFPNEFWINEQAFMAAREAENPARDTETAPKTGDSLLATVSCSGLKTAVWAKASRLGNATAPTAAEPSSSLSLREEDNSVSKAITSRCALIRINGPLFLLYGDVHGHQLLDCEDDFQTNLEC